MDSWLSSFTRYSMVPSRSRAWWQTCPLWLGHTLRWIIQKSGSVGEPFNTNVLQNSANQRRAFNVAPTWGLTGSRSGSQKPCSNVRSDISPFHQTDGCLHPFFWIARFYMFYVLFIRYFHIIPQNLFQRFLKPRFVRCLHVLFCIRQIFQLKNHWMMFGYHVLYAFFLFSLSFIFPSAEQAGV